jgi:nicotinate-nucleotide adenylyltransferase
MQAAFNQQSAISNQQSRRRLGIFGGSFNPVHYGHLLLAETCREQARLDEVWFVPNALSPLKQDQPPAAAKHRVEMLHLAIGGHESFRLSTTELDRGGISYTVDTLAEIAAQQPASELYFLMGGDSLVDLPKWRDPQRICELALPLVVRRHGSPEPRYDVFASLLTAERLELVRQMTVDMPIIELSASDLRRRAAAGLSLRYRTPRAVEKYIDTHRLYVEAAQASS